MGTGHCSARSIVSDELYCYPPDFSVLRNKFDIRDAAALEHVERRIAVDRISIGCPAGDFDLNHLRSIHSHIFQDVYAWAGSLRDVEMRKGSTQFMPRQFIETGMADVHRRIVSASYLKNMSQDAFAEKAAEIIGDINHIHPFREGNGRTQLQYLKQLADRAGHRIDLRRLEPTLWIDASISSNDGDYSKMQCCIARAMDPMPHIPQSEYARALRQSQQKTAGINTTKEQERD